MTTAQHARSTVLSSLIDDIIAEKLITKEIKTNDTISFDYLTSETRYPKRHIAFLRNYPNDLFTVEANTIKVTSDVQALTDKVHSYKNYLIKNCVCPSKHKSNEPACVLRFFSNEYYTENELKFIDEAFKEVSQVIDTDFATQVPERHLLKFNHINRKLQHIAKDVYSGIIQNKLHFGDDITDMFQALSNGKNQENYLDVLLHSIFFKMFFEIVKGKVILLCDINTNKNLLFLNFLNTAIFKVYDTKAKVTLLRNLHTVYGSFERKK